MVSTRDIAPPPGYPVLASNQFADILRTRFLKRGYGGRLWGGLFDKYDRIPPYRRSCLFARIIGAEHGVAVSVTL